MSEIPGLVRAWGPTGADRVGPSEDQTSNVLSKGGGVRRWRRGGGAGRLVLGDMLGVIFTPALIMSNIFGLNLSKFTGEGDGNSLLEIIVDSETSPSGEGVAARSFLLCLLAGVMLTKNDVEMGP